MDLGTHDRRSDLKIARVSSLKDEGRVERPSAEVLRFGTLARFRH